MWVRTCWNWLQIMCIMFFWLTFCFDCDQGYDQGYTLQFQEHWLTHLLSLKVTRIRRPWLSKLNVWGGRSFGLGCQTFSVSLSHSVMCQSKSRKNINLNKVKSTNIKGRFFTWGSHRPVLKMTLFHFVISMDCIERPTWHKSSKPHWWSPLASPIPQHTRGQNQWSNKIYLFQSDLT